MSKKTKKKEAEQQEPEVVEETTDWKDKYLRTLADLDNMRKRNERERDLHRKYASEGVIRDLLPLLDALQFGADAAGDADAIREGLCLAHADAMRILIAYGLEPIEALDQPFDPRWHEAVGMRPDSEKPPGTVVLEEQRGYRLHDRVLRPSRVHISVAPPEASEESEESE